MLKIADIATHKRHILCLAAFCCAVTGCAQLPRVMAPGYIARDRGPISEPAWDVAEKSVNNSRRADRIAGAEMSRGLVSKPSPFRWESIGNSAGGRKIQSVTVGTGGYRTIVLGSLAGNDSAAISLTEEFAKHIHRNSIILGGIEATIIRNPNPDGASNKTMQNDDGYYLNRHFPGGGHAANQRPAEVRLILKQLSERLPQRVIHLRTCDGAKGFIAASSGATKVAQDSAKWLGFDFVELPGRAARGTVENYLAGKSECDVITVAVPATESSTEAWETYGDALLNMLLDEDFETRKLARKKRSQSASRQGSETP